MYKTSTLSLRLSRTAETITKGQHNENMDMRRSLNDDELKKRLTSPMYNVRAKRGSLSVSTRNDAPKSPNFKKKSELPPVRSKSALDDIAVVDAKLDEIQKQFEEKQLKFAKKLEDFNSMGLLSSYSQQIANKKSQDSQLNALSTSLQLPTLAKYSLPPLDRTEINEPNLNMLSNMRSNYKQLEEEINKSVDNFTKNTTSLTVGTSQIKTRRSRSISLSPAKSPTLNHFNYSQFL